MDINIEYDIEDNKKKECNTQSQIAYTIYYIFHIIMALIAIFLSWKCNQGFNLLSFIIALIFPYLYIIYTFATNGICSNIVHNK